MTEVCEGVSLLQMTCMPDLVIEIKPGIGKDGTTNCFNHWYPQLDMTDLIIGKPGTQWKQSEDYCDAASSDIPAKTPNKFWGSTEFDSSVPSTGSLFFKATECGSYHQVVEIDGTEYLQFTSSIMSKMFLLDGILTEQVMLETNINCNYPVNTENVDFDFNTEIDPYVGTKVAINKMVEEIDTSLVSFHIYVNGELYEGDSDVVLGSSVSVTFDSIGEIDRGFYIESCQASNSDQSLTAVLVQDGCANSDPDEPNFTIEPKIDEIGTTLTYNQFAYVAASGNPGDPILEFQLSCVLKFGVQPNQQGCTNVRTRKSSDIQKENVVNLEIPVTLPWSDCDLSISNKVTTAQKKTASSSVKRLLYSAFMAMTLLML